jgi:putative endonuclease
MGPVRRRDRQPGAAWLATPQHQVEGFTSRYHIVRLVWYELHGDMEHAITREKRLKKWNRLWKLRLINEFNPEWRDLWPDLLGSIGSPPARG